jgi:hypothetical protein
LTYDAGIWKNKVVTVKINGSTTNVTKTVSAGEISFDLAIVNSSPVIHPLTGASSVQYSVVNATRFPLGGQPFPYAVLHGNMVTLHGVLQLNIISFSWNHLGAILVATLPTAVRPAATDVYFNVELYIKVGANYSATYTRATGHITPGGNLNLILMNPAGGIVLTSGDLIEVVIGGVTYAI